MTVAIATEPSAVERYRQLMKRKETYAFRGTGYIETLTALRNVLVERLEGGKQRIYEKQENGENVGELAGKWIALLHEYESVSDELHSLAPQLAVEAYLTSLNTQPKAHSV